LRRQASANVGVGVDRLLEVAGLLPGGGDGVVDVLEVGGVRVALHVQFAVLDGLLGVARAVAIDGGVEQRVLRARVLRIVLGEALKPRGRVLVGHDLLVRGGDGEDLIRHQRRVLVRG
jgi:hypothetical protein